jgi:RHS repeat-associated protein
MRRICALVLVAIFSLQTTASAASPGQLHGPNMQPLVSAIEGSQIFAVLTGHESRYAAINAPAPSPAPKHTPMAVHPPVFNYHAEARTLMSGNARIVSGEPKHPMYPWQFQAESGSAQTSARHARAATPMPRATAAARVTASRATMRPMVAPTATPSAPPTTGINRWWDYEEGAIPGVGKYMVNVGTGNLLVQANDVDIPERGIDLAFRRTYNSQSLHDAANDDGSVQSNFGDGWTNTFDAHLGASGGTTSGVANIVSVYDIDGARYDYTFSSTTTGGGAIYSPPAGMQGTTLNYDGSCSVYWTKKTGTQYVFYAPFATGCNTTSDTGSFGRIIYIFGRNSNNYLHFVYSWNGNDSSSDNLSSIAVTHSDGQSLTLEFGKFSGSSHAELAHVVRPDGDTVDFYYDTTTGTHLTEVDQPGHGSGGLYSQYAYYGSSDQLNYVCSPRYVAAYNAGTNDGGCTLFSFAATDINGVTNNNVTTGAWDWVWANFAPPDGTGSSLQPTLNNGYYYQDSRTFAYSSAPSSNSTWETWMTDTDGHSTQYFVDAAGRLTQQDDYIGSSQVTWLIRTNSWDANNDLTSTIDPRGYGLSGTPNPYETDYAYDANGNTLAVALPAVTTSAGSLRPTSTYAYDSYNNVLSYCDPVYNTSNNWYNPANSPPVCPTSGIGDGYTVYSWSETDTNEPFGYLTDTYTPLGYHRSVAYSTSSQGGDFGLPTSVTGAPYRQNDNTVRTPTQTFTYDSYGDLATYNKGNGSWTLAYDVLHRTVSREDPDNVTNYTCYNADSTVALARSASQYAADGSVSCASVTPSSSAGVSYSYDQDGNTVSEEHHHACLALSGCQAGITAKWYDGADRLVEVRQPQDGNDAYAFAWMTRYIYDISQGQPQSINGGATNFPAYGNLYKTQECIQSTSVQLAGPTTSNIATPAPPSNTPTAPSYSNSCSFQDLRGNTFDALDRSQTKYEVAAGTSPEQTSVYDSNGEYGLLSEKTNPTGQTDTLSYDDDGHLSAEAFTDGVTPNRNFTYDPDGREVSLTSATMGTQTRTFDADGRLTSASDPASEQDPGTITYGYYPDGMRSSLSLTVPSLSFNQSNLFEYSYRADGQRSSLVTAIGAGNNTFSWTYSNAGRELSQSDPLVGMTTVNSIGVTEYTIATKTLAYDTYGRLSSLSLPRGMNPKGSIEYDLEDAEVSSTYASAATPVLQHTTRNELSGVNQTSQYANGVSCTTVGETCTFDSRSGEMLQQQALVTPSGGSPFYAVHAYTYDAAGRETADTLTCGSAAPLQGTRAYDTDNHIIAQNIPTSFSSNNSCTTQSPNAPNPEALSYSWAADGRLANFATTQYTGGTPPSTTNASAAHWDGDDLLYVSLEGVGIELYVEKLGWLTQSSNGVWTVVVYDRDQTGTAVDRHGGTSGSTTAGFSQLTLDVVHLYGNAHAACKGGIMSGIACSGVTTNPIAATAGGASCAVPPTTNQECASAPTTGNPILDASREDGYFDGTLSLQGVRAYDPNLNQWTTPDAYSGDVHDPMSQHPYMWNNNNPVQYSDPTGYCIEDGCVGEGLVAAAVVEGGAELLAAGADAVGEAGVAAGARATAAGVARVATTAAAAGRALAGNVTQGVYKFSTSVAGAVKTYVGKSVNVGVRLAQHIRSGKLAPEHFSSAVAVPIQGGTAALSAAEQQSMDELGGIGGGQLANKINAVAGGSSATNTSASLPHP